MKLAWVIALVLMLIGFAVLFRPPRIDETMAPPVEPTAPHGASTTTHSEDVAGVDAPVRAGERSAIAGAPSVDGPHTRVTGRCVDERGHPLADVVLTLNSVGEKWSARVSAPFVLVEGRPQLRFRAKSESDGRFRFDVPSPDATSIELVATSGPERLELTSMLEHVIGRADVDLGDLRFASAGRITGRVHRSGGEPVEGVLVRARLGERLAECESDHDGRFALDRLVGGTWSLNATMAYQPVASPPPVEVKVGGDPIAIEIVANPGPVFEGRIVDPEGAPIVTATVQAGDRYAHPGIDRASTDSDGRFKLQLTSRYRESLILLVQHPGFALAEVPVSTATDARGIQVVLQPSPRMTFRVVDARTGAPIERYRIELVVADSTCSMEFWVQEEDHARGEALLAVDAGDSMVLVDAPGHARLQAQVAADDPGGTVQTLHMSPGASLYGRATIAGSPVAGVDVHARIGQPRIPQVDLTDSVAVREAVKKSGSRYRAQDDWPGRDRSVTTGADGRFRFGELPRGSWVVNVGGIGIASRALDPIDVAEGQEIDIGDLRLDAGACIEGRLLLPEGIDPRYVSVTLDRHALNVNADENGIYRFEGLEAGQHRVEVPRDNHLGLDGRFSEVDLGAYERRHLDFDLREAVLARVRVRVVRNGAPMASGYALAESAPGQRTSGRVSLDNMGTADLRVPPRALFRVAVEDGDRIVARSGEMTLDPGGHAEVEVTVDP